MRGGVRTRATRGGTAVGRRVGRQTAKGSAQCRREWGRSQRRAEERRCGWLGRRQEAATWAVVSRQGIRDAIQVSVARVAREELNGDVEAEWRWMVRREVAVEVVQCSGRLAAAWLSV
ncbi:uncharacterized protein A4U43_C06F15380 [Asparagus officinalis]|uniref:Uncharacterized protein n=1 Tax=Asparagus officinalis TaxID=4686 RepID=A0A5P1EN39_ASPOF|nr:uncharacterized protein A4U43_C06F15380 [Asparagus officinalis]